MSFLKPYYKKAGIEQVFRDVSNEEWYKAHSGLIRYNTGIISKIMDNVKGLSSATKGYAPLVGAMTEDRDVASNTYNPVDSLKLRYIERIVDLAQSHKLPIVFVGSPKYGANNSSVLKPVIEICAKKQVPFLDYYSDQKTVTHKEWFKEPMHLNKTGAREFSRRISDEIRTLYSCE